MNKRYFELFNEARNGKQQAITELESLANKYFPDKESLTTLASCHYYGYVVPQNYDMAFELYQRAATLECDVAMFSLGYMFEYGLGTSQNLETAAYWYCKSAMRLSIETANVNDSFNRLRIIANHKQPNRIALHNLGFCYEMGYGITKDYAKAADSYTRAALLGYDPSMYSLGRFYQYGLGVQKNLYTAFFWYTESKNRRTKETKHINHSKGMIKEVERQIRERETDRKEQYSYDTQIIIDFRSNGNHFSWTALTRSVKWKKMKGSACYMLTGHDLLSSNHQITAPKTKGSALRIYIVGHCWRGVDELYFEDLSQEIHFDKLADLLKQFIGQQKVVISLMTCCAGIGYQANARDSFAAKLHWSLFQKTKVDTHVIARTSVSCAWAFSNQQVTLSLQQFQKYENNCDHIITNDATLNNKLYIHQQPGSKVIFMMKNNRQWVVDGYLYPEITRVKKYKWKHHVTTSLIKAKDSTDVKGKEILLKKWLGDFEKESTDKIYQTMHDELQKGDDKTLLKKHNYGIFEFFGLPTNTESKIKILIQDAESIGLVSKQVV